MNGLKREASPVTPPRASRRKLFVPSGVSQQEPATSEAPTTIANDVRPPGMPSDDGAGATPASSTGRYTLRQRTAVKAEDRFLEAGPSVTRSLRSIRAASRAQSGATAIADSPEEARIKAEDVDADKSKIKKPKPSPFDVSPQKKNQKPIKLNLDESEVKPAPKRWRQQLDVLSKQRRRIIAPVDEMGCEENGRDDRRADAWREEDGEEKSKRERFTVLVSLMLSSQTKDEVTAQAVKNLQTNLPLGLSLEGVLSATDDQISSNISKVGFWRRKTGYIKSAASIIASEFEGDVPKDVDELCSLPGVGPKMAFLCLQSAWKINLGIGVDVHVHRLSNRLGWCKTNDPEGTRLVLQSWLPKELHHSINKTLVGFGQVLCVPVGPRCDLCDLGKARLCPSYRKVDPKAAATRKQVVLLPKSDSDSEDVKSGLAEDMKTGNEAKLAVSMEGPDGTGLIKTEVTEGDEAVPTVAIKSEPVSTMEW
ncbi:unnamed protein product [Parajaminaea phylloscopi]